MTRRAPRRRAGITLTEILISILIMGIGMISLATLFPLGLLRIEQAQNYSRSALLQESAFDDLEARNLLFEPSFQATWYGTFYPLSPFLYDPSDPTAPTVGAPPPFGNGNGTMGVLRTYGDGLPVAYDPLWRAVVGYPPLVASAPAGTPEARFASGVGFLRSDPVDNSAASAYGLQRLTNLPLTTAGVGLAGDIFTSPDDIVFQTAGATLNTFAGEGAAVLPDLSNLNNLAGPQVMTDWVYTWMFTGKQSDVSNAKVYDGDIVVRRNRPFSLDMVVSPLDGNTYPQAAGEEVFEAIFGYGNDRSVLLRWPAGMADPKVRSGGWIADVTYERYQLTSNNRFNGVNFPADPGRMNPGQRCIWYRVARHTEPTLDPVIAGYRSMVVTLTGPVRVKSLPPGYVNQPPLNAALVDPSVVYVFPKIITVR